MPNTSEIYAPLPSINTNQGKPLRALWLHTQPEHYFNLMIDDLNRTNPFVEYIAVFAYKGSGTYTELPLPQHSRSVLLKPYEKFADQAPGSFQIYHENWEAQIEKLDPHIVFVAGYSGRTQREITMWCSQRGIPTVMWSDSNIRSQRGKNLKHQLFRYAKKQYLQTFINTVDYLFTANSRGVAYWRYFGAPREKIMVCPCYADYGRIATAKEISRQQAFGFYHLDPTRKLILTIARLVPAKSLDLSLKAFLESGLIQKGWTYAIAGSGPKEKELKALAGTELNKSIFMLGFCQPAEILPLLGHAELFLLPSSYEPHGIVIQEAAAAGTPSITSDACGASHDLINPGRSGWLFRSGDKNSLIKTLQLATEHPELTTTLRLEARKSFDLYFQQKSPINIINQVSTKLLLKNQLLDPDTQKPRFDVLDPAIHKNTTPPLRIAICQPLIPLYRIPIFNMLGRQPGIRLTVLGGHSQGSLQALFQGKYFHADVAPVIEIPYLSHFVTQSAQLDVLDPKRFDMVIIPWDIHYISMFRAIFQAKKIDMPIILWGHGYSKHASHRRFDWLRNWAGKKATGVLLYTKTVAQYLTNNKHFNPNLVFVAQNALDQSLIQTARREWLAQPEALADFRKKHRVGTDHTIIFVSRLEKSNHIDQLLHAVAKLRQAKRDINAVIIGKGPEENHLKHLAKQLKISDDILFPGAIYNESQLAPWMLSAGVFCYPEEIGLSILHAFGYGLPAVTCDDIASQNPEVEALIHGENGFFFRKGNIDEMAQRCGEILADSSLRERLSQNARKQILQRYTLPNMVQGFLDATKVVDGYQRTVVVPSEFLTAVQAEQ